MLKLFSICLCIVLSPVQLLTAQEKPTHTISELNALLQKSKVDTQRVNLLLEAALVYVMKPGMEKNHFDSALSFINQAMNVSGSLNEPVSQGRCFSVYSQLYREGNQTEQGKKYIDSAISIFTKYDQKENLGDAYSELQLYYDVYSDSEWHLRIKYAELAEQLYKQNGNKLKQAGVLKHLGDFYQIKGKDSIALKCLHESLAIYQSIQYPEVQGVYDLIGLILFHAGDYNQALKYGLLAVETAERLKTGSVELSTIYNRVGITYFLLIQYQEATNYFTKSFSIALRNKDTLAAIAIAPNVMESYFRLRKQPELVAFLKNARFIYDKGSLRDKTEYISNFILAYLISGNSKEAEPFVRDLLRLVDETTADFPSLRHLHRAVIPYYVATGQYNKMLKYLPANDSLCRKYSIMPELADNYLWWFKADSALGDHTAAIAHYKLYKEASDSSLRLTANQQINQLLIQYESLKKDKTIASKESNIVLLTSQAKLQQAQLRQTRVVRNLTYGAAGLLLIIAALLYNRYRLKQRTNGKLELQQREITNQNLSLQHLVNEKEWLLKEIHHRVKNNLQIVMSLLNSQSAYIDNEPALTAIHDSQHRVHAMSLIHQKLYGTDNVSSIDMPSYIRELASYLRDSFDTGQRIHFEFDIAPLELDVSQAVPVGLILNEAITNSIKYAFPNDSDGVISISLSNTSPHHYLLTISDNGIGMPAHFTGKKPGSLGMSLMAGLAEDLDGSFSIENNKGTEIKISFVHDLSIKRPDILISSFVTNN